jgi:hypothetical protein
MPRQVYQLINNRIATMFRQISLAELVDPDTLAALLEADAKAPTPPARPAHA